MFHIAEASFSLDKPWLFAHEIINIIASEWTFHMGFEISIANSEMQCKFILKQKCPNVLEYFTRGKTNMCLSLCANVIAKPR